MVLPVVLQENWNVSGLWIWALHGTAMFVCCFPLKSRKVGLWNNSILVCSCATNAGFVMSDYQTRNGSIHVEHDSDSCPIVQGKYLLLPMILNDTVSQSKPSVVLPFQPLIAAWGQVWSPTYRYFVVVSSSSEGPIFYTVIICYWGSGHSIVSLLEKLFWRWFIHWLV